jgi:hypothetical protein
MNFEFIDTPSRLVGPSEFVIQVPARIKSKPELLAEFARMGRFPDHFGGNWDAFLDCLRDLSWISNRTVSVVHADLPLADNPGDCRIYLDILQTALSDWASSAKADVVTPPPGWEYVEHELRIVFPIDFKAAVLAST